MKKLHEKVIRRLRSKPTLATPWRGDFTMNISWEVFDLIYHKIVKSNIIKQLWPSVKRENQPVLTLESRTGKRQYFVFNKMNQGGILISRNHLLKKCLGNCAGGVHAVERCEVVVCREKPMRFKYHHSTEVLSFIMVIGIRRSTTLINGYNTSNYDLLPKSVICMEHLLYSLWTGSQVGYRVKRKIGEPGGRSTVWGEEELDFHLCHRPHLGACSQVIALESRNYFLVLRNIPAVPISIMKWWSNWRTESGTILNHTTSFYVLHSSITWSSPFFQGTVLKINITYQCLGMVLLLISWQRQLFFDLHLFLLPIGFHCRFCILKVRFSQSRSCLVYRVP